MAFESPKGHDELDSTWGVKIRERENAIPKGSVKDNERWKQWKPEHFSPIIVRESLSKNWANDGKLCV